MNTYMNLNTKNLPSGSYVWKGFTGSYNTNVLESEKYFFVSPKKEYANIYMHPNLLKNNPRFTPHVCTYSLTRNLKLIKLTPNNIKIILSTLVKKSDDHKLIQFAFSSGKKAGKTSLLKQLVRTNLYERYKLMIPKKTSRVSFHETNKRACKVLCSKLRNFDGYYYEGGEFFHDEIMICNASDKLLKVECTQYYKKPITKLTNTRHVRFAKNILNNPSPTSAELRRLENIPGRNMQLLIRKKRDLMKLSEKLKNLFTLKFPNKKFYLY